MFKLVSRVNVAIITPDEIPHAAGMIVKVIRGFGKDSPCLMLDKLHLVQDMNHEREKSLGCVRWAKSASPMEMGSLIKGGLF